MSQLDKNLKFSKNHKIGVYHLGFVYKQNVIKITTPDLAEFVLLHTVNKGQIRSFRLDTAAMEHLSRACLNLLAFSSPFERLPISSQIGLIFYL